MDTQTALKQNAFDGKLPAKAQKTKTKKQVTISLAET